jgi:Spy/CpxP family protein refolding chaperone
MLRLIAFFAILASFSLAGAQAMPFGLTGRFMLTMAPDVKKELKITKQQEQKMKQAAEDYGKEIQADPGKMTDMMNPMAGLDPKLDAIFDEAQRARLEDLYLQFNGGWALTDAKVALALALTPQQIEQVKSTDTEAKADLMKMMGSLRSNNDLKKLKAKNKEAGDKMKAVLTPEQTAKLEAMMGKPFKFKN